MMPLVKHFSKQMKALQFHGYLTELRAWAAYDARRGSDPKQRAISPRADRYERREKTQGWPRAIRATKTKQRLNNLVAEATTSSDSQSDIVLLLDGSDGRTSRALQEQLPEVHCLAPNVAPETQQNLEKLPNCTSWCGRIEDMGLHFDLASRPWLPTGQNWSQGLALFALVSAMRRCARAVCLDVAGIDLPGLNDYDLFHSTGQVDTGHLEDPAALAVEALQRGDHLRMAQAMLTWSKESRGIDLLDWLRDSVVEGSELQS
eukprot:symbB.v1.2.009450.t1/scaffold601.1/size182750/14